ncbi:Teichoic acids export ATP-binding protein TagH [Eubacteriaceae bacterium CHKCI004]|nr:Teichoic acids export ATP-binding protein TagH [Eubacteriaceae bacterium CHKCI004]
MSEYAIDVQNVSKIYRLYDRSRDRLAEALHLTKKKLSKDHYALDQINFQVKKGETVGIIGTNGSGKSTILKIITGVLNPTAGKVEIDGRISALLELGAGFNMEYTGIQNVYLNGTMIGFSEEEIKAKLDDILEFADIGDFVYQPVKTYSSGMFVRLAFAVAININPEILIVDEALSVGDVFFQAKCYHKFEEFKKEGKTIVIVSHDLSSISKYCDRVILLNKGHKLAEGEPKKIVDLYKKLLVNQLTDDDLEDYEEEAGENVEKKLKKEHNEDAQDNLDAITDASAITPESVEKEGKLWKDYMMENPDVIDYGTKEVEIIDYCILDEKGYISNNIEKGSEYTVKFKVHFNEKVNEPILAFTIKDIKGTEVTGTNTMYEKIDFESEQGQTCVVSFTQKMNLTKGDYLISFGCTGFRDGNFTVYHRKYDVMNLLVIADKENVGFFDMFSEVTVSQG